jgi:hypothetical protein
MGHSENLLEELNRLGSLCRNLTKALEELSKASLKGEAALVLLLQHGLSLTLGTRVEAITASYEHRRNDAIHDARTNTVQSIHE